MPSRLFDLYQDTYYHVYNRGLNKQQLFFSDADYQRFGKTIQRYLVDFPAVEIKAYCFLPNHFHFLLRESGSTESGLLKVRTHEPVSPKPDFSEPAEAQQISDFMRKVQQSYAMYFNRYYKDKLTPGIKMPVFEGRFQVKEILDDAYLAQIATYIEYNAVKHELVEKPEDWQYTSYPSASDSSVAVNTVDALFD